VAHGRISVNREDAARGAVRGGAAARLVSPHHVAGAAQPVQGDRCVLEEVDELSVLHEEGCEFAEGCQSGRVVDGDGAREGPKG